MGPNWGIKGYTTYFSRSGCDYNKKREQKRARYQADPSKKKSSKGVAMGVRTIASDHDAWRRHNRPLALIIITTWKRWQAICQSGGVFQVDHPWSITEFFSTGSSSSCLPRTGVSSPNAADAVVDDDEASRQYSDCRLSPLPETETVNQWLLSRQLRRRPARRWWDGSRAAWEWVSCVKQSGR